jgi:hypothetical protein
MQVMSPKSGDMQKFIIRNTRHLKKTINTLTQFTFTVQHYQKSNVHA